MNFPISVHPVPGMRSFPFVGCSNCFTKCPFLNVSQILTFLPLLFFLSRVSSCLPISSPHPPSDLPFFISPPSVPVLYGIMSPLIRFAVLISSSSLHCPPSLKNVILTLYITRNRCQPLQQQQLYYLFNKYLPTQ